jgi:hypothetical protein
LPPAASAAPTLRKSSSVTSSRPKSSAMN